ncbi:hypothetical protein DPMN_187818 [Dreissena polymorpha]|uniref:C1q domain-containing protein n=1 Tax=Dreissena polymorpha TaxID=45954 RepID=A0A9D4DST1_DREPO|nr:hypothetical protein DPMN_187818 [Dreissena polymorpha]
MEHLGVKLVFVFITVNVGISSTKRVDSALVRTEYQIQTRLNEIEMAVRDLDNTLEILGKGLSDAKAFQKEMKSEFAELKELLNSRNTIDSSKHDPDIFFVNESTNSTLEVIISTQHELKQNEALGSDKERIQPKRHNSSRIVNRYVQPWLFKPHSKRTAAENVAFSAYLSYMIPHLAIGHVIKCDRTLLNDGNAYNTATGIFTVPITGVYLLSASIDSLKNTHVKVVVDNANTFDLISDSKTQSMEVMSSNTMLVHLVVGQSVWMEQYGNNDGQIISGDEWRYTTFSGVLLY